MKELLILAAVCWVLYNALCAAHGLVQVNSKHWVEEQEKQVERITE